MRSKIWLFLLPIIFICSYAGSVKAQETKPLDFKLEDLSHVIFESKDSYSIVHPTDEVRVMKNVRSRDGNEIGFTFSFASKRDYQKLFANKDSYVLDLRTIDHVLIRKGDQIEKVLPEEIYQADGTLCENTLAATSISTPEGVLIGVGIESINMSHGLPRLSPISNPDPCPMLPSTSCNPLNCSYKKYNIEGPLTSRIYGKCDLDANQNCYCNSAYQQCGNNTIEESEQCESAGDCISKLGPVDPGSGGGHYECIDCSCVSFPDH